MLICTFVNTTFIFNNTFFLSMMSYHLQTVILVTSFVYRSTLPTCFRILQGPLNQHSRSAGQTYTPPGLYHSLILIDETILAHAICSSMNIETVLLQLNAGTSFCSNPSHFMFHPHACACVDPQLYK